MTQAYGPYSPIRKSGNLYYLSGQVGVNPITKKAAKNIKAQTKQTLRNIKSLLAANQLKVDNVIKTTIFLTDINDFRPVNAIYVDFFNEPRPARSCLEVSALPKVANEKLLVEIEAIAYKN